MIALATRIILKKLKSTWQVYSSKQVLVGQERFNFFQPQSVWNLSWIMCCLAMKTELCQNLMKNCTNAWLSFDEMIVRLMKMQLLAFIAVYSDFCQQQEYWKWLNSIKSIIEYKHLQPLNCKIKHNVAFYIFVEKANKDLYKYCTPVIFYFDDLKIMCKVMKRILLQMRCYPLYAAMNISKEHTKEKQLE